MRPQKKNLPDALKRNALLRPESFDGTVLVPIVEEAFRRAEALPEATGENVRRAMAAPRASSGFEEALAAPGFRFILEVKGESPTLGVIRSRVDEAEYARVYGRFADAVSCLTEPMFFGGSFGRLASLRKLTHKPLLAKDFIVSERQILAARSSGADAVLLMLSVLSKEGFARLFAFAKRLGLDVLAEVSDEAELRDALELGAVLIGVNNRNLRDLSIDLTRTERLGRLIPGGRIAVSESGIGDHADVLRLAPHAKAFLIGSAIGLSDDLSKGVRRILFGESKVCGITRAEDALFAAKSGALTAGLIFARRSPRAIPAERASGLASEIRALSRDAGLPLDIAAVADAGDPLSLEAASLAAPDVLQVHGAEDEASLLRLRQSFPGVKLCAAFGMSGEAAEEKISRIDRMLASGVIDRALLDSGSGARTGGTGKTLSFSLPARFENRGRVILAGGLAPENAFRASLSGAAGLDFNSGLETAPGIKSHVRTAAAFAALRGVQENNSDF